MYGLTLGPSVGSGRKNALFFRHGAPDSPPCGHRRCIESGAMPHSDPEENPKMSYLSPTEFVTKMVDAGES